MTDRPRASETSVHRETGTTDRIRRARRWWSAASRTLGVQKHDAPVVDIVVDDSRRGEFGEVAVVERSGHPVDEPVGHLGTRPLPFALGDRLGEGRERRRAVVRERGDRVMATSVREEAEQFVPGNGSTQCVLHRISRSK